MSYLSKVFFSLLLGFCSSLYGETVSNFDGTYQLTEVLCESSSFQTFRRLSQEELQTLSLTQRFDSEAQTSILSFSLPGISSAPCNIQTTMIYEVYEGQLALAVDEFETSGDCRFLPLTAGQPGVTTIYEIESLTSTEIRLIPPSQTGPFGASCGAGYRSVEVWTRRDLP